jgi:hypothetical protein
MKCPYCDKAIDDEAVLKEAASIMGRRSRRRLTKEQAQAMAKKSHEMRKPK